MLLETYASYSPSTTFRMMLTDGYILIYKLATIRGALLTYGARQHGIASAQYNTSLAHLMMLQRRAKHYVATTSLTLAHLYINQAYAH
jgi:hypothetical protein